MQTPELWITGLGRFVPETESVRDAVRAGLCTAEEAAEHQMTGAAVAGDLPAPEMALRAARDALADAGADPAAVRLLLYADTWHQGPDGWFPQYHLHRELDLGDIVALEVRQGCNGLFNALELAAPYLAAGPSGGTALLVAADNYGTPGVNRWRSGDFVFGDGAGALLLGRTPGRVRVLSVGTAAVPEMEGLHRFGEPDFPPRATVGATLDLRSRMEKFTAHVEETGDGTRLWVTLQKKMILLAGRVLGEAGIVPGDVARVVLNSLAPGAQEHRWLEIMGIGPERSTWDYARGIGHIGASDPVLGLHHLLSTGAVAPGDHVVLGGIGSGLTVSCAVVRVEDPAGEGAAWTST
ncbi:ketoacyl-ACP synthase III family protein [Nocardiopsis trehalosi]|uniref:ketoacyl-ACP synthase III family protein n=1 Tax=Nocardiopsis trehalosi TaxID=109329 RepID=UPI00082AC1C6|nr:ketoacyl-ACP synthase III family protein [Nocardiopsis trehalosi]